MTSRMNPYIQFRDTAKDALEFYARVFGGELTISTFGDMGVEGAEADKVMHGMLTTPSGFTLMASDTPEQMEHTPGGSITISLSGDDADDLRGWFAALSEGADVTLPLAVQMWGDEFAMLTDSFGTNWMVNIATSQARPQA